MKGPNIRLAAKGDVDGIASIAVESGQSSWNERALSEVLENPQAIVFVCVAEDIIAGYVILYYAADEGEITSIAVSDQFRRQGFGRLLIEEISREALGRGVLKIYLEVRSSNAAARGLYNSTNFCEVGIRKGFYTDPIEDAIVMVREL